jgi:plasmid stability protein
MRTTLRMDDALYRAVKEHAARHGRTVGEVIEDAVRTALHDEERRTSEDLPELNTYGGSGTLPGVDLADRASLLEIMEADEDVDALR